MAASLCTHCNTYQGYRRFLNISQTSLALLIALISVTGTLIPPLAKVLFRDSHLEKNLISIDQTGAIFVVTNSGNMPGSVISAEVEFPLSEGRSTRLALPVAVQIIEPGKSQLVKVTPSDAPALLVTAIYQSLTTSGCSLRLSLLSYRGEVSKHVEEIECDRLTSNLFTEGTKAIFAEMPPAN
ncbi:hypothetical protein HFO94_27595 [Rhizobium leguminosarum]|uniref:hypothetical protein n=1 Tax=Rhizobium leguminosarum TaxID=384 RepID=UPI001C950B09|nr:hypothetical protein [Rhizobium leguminosarum]MBY5357247.1 hypothetical protein [Rhizobium leguminosarum]